MNQTFNLQKKRVSQVMQKRKSVWIALQNISKCTNGNHDFYCILLCLEYSKFSVILFMMKLLLNIFLSLVQPRQMCLDGCNFLSKM